MRFKMDAFHGNTQEEIEKNKKKLADKKNSNYNAWCQEYGKEFADQYCEKTGFWDSHSCTDFYNFFGECAVCNQMAQDSPIFVDVMGWSDEIEDIISKDNEVEYKI